MSQERFFEYANRLISHEKRKRDAWARELNVTVRTITNFNQRLEKDYGILVRKSSGDFGYYYIDRDNSRKYEEFINFIQNLNTPSKIAESFDYKEEFGRHLIFHQNWNRVPWMKHFNDLVNAINQQCFISLSYISFRTEKSATVSHFMPYWLKQNAYYRWYIIGFEDETASEPMVIGMDKILHLTIESQTFSRTDERENFRELYESAFGVYAYPDREEEIVRLECTRFQANYLKSLPLHISQEIQFEDDLITIFRYQLVINHEFAYELLRQNVWNYDDRITPFAHPHRTAIKVLEPAWLADYFRQAYKRAYQSYATDRSISHKLQKSIASDPYPYPIKLF